jgi:hypothetical protein
LRAYAFAQCSLYGSGKINIKDILQPDESGVPLIPRRFSEDMPVLQGAIHKAQTTTLGVQQ